MDAYVCPLKTHVGFMTGYQGERKFIVTRRENGLIMTKTEGGGMGWMLNGGIDLINRKGLDVSSHVRR